MDALLSFDDGDVKEEVIENETLAEAHLRKIEKHVTHSLFKDGEPWPRRTNVACWHCCHTFKTMPIPMIRRYDRLLNRYVCAGIFCSTNCARAYMVEHQAHLSNQAAAYMTIMAKEVFGIPEVSARPARPRIRLKMFGGTLTIEEFRAGFSTPTVEKVVEPLFMLERPVFVQLRPDTEPGVTVTDLLHRQAALRRTKATTSSKDPKEPVESKSSTSAPPPAILQTSVLPGETSVSNNEGSIFEQFMEQMALTNGDEKMARAGVLQKAQQKAKLSSSAVAPESKKRARGGASSSSSSSSSS